MQDRETGYAVGNNNAFIYTTNGTDWYARTGPAAGVNLLSVAINTAGDVFVGGADGNLYRSEDGGVTWIDTAGAAGVSLFWAGCSLRVQRYTPSKTANRRMIPMAHTTRLDADFASGEPRIVPPPVPIRPPRCLG